MLPQPRTDERRRRLLIVQRDPLVARSLARYVRGQFDAVDIASSPEEAEAILSNPSRTPTHVVCGLNFGVSAPSGHEVIPRWRAAYPALACVVLATSQAELPAALDGVDAIYLKPSSPAVLATMLAQV